MLVLWEQVSQCCDGIGTGAVKGRAVLALFRPVSSWGEFLAQVFGPCPPPNLPSVPDLREIFEPGQ